MTIKLPPLPEPYDTDWSSGEAIRYFTADQLRAAQREAALMALEEAEKQIAEMHGWQTLSNQEFPRQWHSVVDAAEQTVRAMRTELEAS